MLNFQKLNFNSIANVCNTDATTVELILKEIVAQVSSLIRTGMSALRINLRVGRFEVKNGEINWKQFSEDWERNARSFTTMKDFEGSKMSVGNSRYSKMPSKKISQTS